VRSTLGVSDDVRRSLPARRRTQLDGCPLQSAGPEGPPDCTTCDNCTPSSPVPLQRRRPHPKSRCPIRAANSTKPTACRGGAAPTYT
jgi:hypothetical protein